MNKDNLHKLIDKYEERFYEINNSEHDEIFKWRAAKHFRDVWFSPEAKNMSFSEMFNEAKREFYILMDNSFVCPSTGIVKVAEKDQEAVARLFNDYLFADDGGDLNKRLINVDLFREGFDKLREIYFPQSYKFKQDRHSAMCYLAFYSPNNNYIYRHKEASTFAQYIEYGNEIGSGKDFRLDYYYDMCDTIVEALKEHQSLLDKHFAFLTEKEYRDESLHILAFDLMYCSRAYNFYDGMTYVPKKQARKTYSQEQAMEIERLEKERKINNLRNEIHELEAQIEQFSDISLINVEVYHPVHGKGIIIDQDKNIVTVRYDSTQKLYPLHKKYSGQPTFEDNENLIEALSQYGDISERIDELKEELDYLLRN